MKLRLVLCLNSLREKEVNKLLLICCDYSIKKPCFRIEAGADLLFKADTLAIHPMNNEHIYWCFNIVISRLLDSCLVGCAWEMQPDSSVTEEDVRRTPFATVSCKSGGRPSSVTVSTSPGKSLSILKKR